jgi:hypothetical protein
MSLCVLAGCLITPVLHSSHSCPVPGNFAILTRGPPSVGVRLGTQAKGMEGFLGALEHC